MNRLLFTWFVASLLFAVGCGAENGSQEKSGAEKKSAGPVGGGQKKGDPETLVRSGYDEKEMDAAIARARKEVDQFLKEFEAKNGNSFSVKAPIEDNGQTEHFWLTDVTYQDGKFEGMIGNDPGIVKNVKFGQKWTIAKEDISDWMFVRKGLIHGNFTMRPLLKTLPKNQADAFRKKLANPDQ